MTTTESEILDALRELEAAVRSARHGQPKVNLSTLFERIDHLTGALPRETPPDLLHYLHRKSYEKARLWLEGREAENQRGSCRH